MNFKLKTAKLVFTRVKCPASFVQEPTKYGRKAVRCHLQSFYVKAIFESKKKMKLTADGIIYGRKMVDVFGGIYSPLVVITTWEKLFGLLRHGFWIAKRSTFFFRFFGSTRDSNSKFYKRSCKRPYKYSHRLLSLITPDVLQFNHGSMQPTSTFFDFLGKKDPDVGTKFRWP